MKNSFVRNLDNMARSHEYYAQRIVRTCRGPSNRRPSRTRSATTLPSLGARSSLALACSLTHPHHPRPSALELRTAHRRHGIARCACALGSMCRRTGAVCAGTCGARCATPPPIQSTPARAWQGGRRVRDVSVVRGRRPPSSGGCTYLRGIKVVRWPRIQPPDVALQQTGRHASGGASVRRRRRVVTHHRGGRCARCLCLYQLLFVC